VVVGVVCVCVGGGAREHSTETSWGGRHVCKSNEVFRSESGSGSSGKGRTHLPAAAAAAAAMLGLGVRCQGVMCRDWKLLSGVGQH
jgi:hypothetical protein